MKSTFLTVITLTVLGMSVNLASAQNAVPSVIPYSGFLEVPEGVLAVNLEVRLQREGQADVWTTVWCEQHLNTPIHRKRFHINIGRPAGNPPVCDNGDDFSLEDDFLGLFARGQVWLQLVVNGTPLARQQFLAAPYAAVAAATTLRARSCSWTDWLQKSQNRPGSNHLICSSGSYQAGTRFTHPFGQTGSNSEFFSILCCLP